MNALQLVWAQRGRRWARRAGERIGALGQLGLGLLLGAAALALYAPQLARETAALRADSERLQQRLDQERRQQPPAPAQQAAQVREWFPTAERASADLRALFDAARKHRIELAKGEYTLAPAADASRLQRFEVIFPVKERYVAIKAFVAEVLNVLPHASLAELRIERSAAGVDLLDARIHFTLFYREP
jgi:hypothetical protein